ncbi:MAG: hypothetical protein IPO78_08760 [Saprospiraceae bacterium]|nr:hypothetical protein [Saprospiraceae bacterium]
MLKHNENLASQILDQFNVDYESYRSELEYLIEQKAEDPGLEDLPQMQHPILTHTKMSQVKEPILVNPVINQ